MKGMIAITGVTLCMLATPAFLQSTTVAGFDSEAASTDGGDEQNYRVLRSNDAPRAGILANPVDDLDAVWVNYLRVEDPAAITARVESLGGSVLLEARDRDIGGQAAIIMGPSGAAIALQTWPLN